MAFWSAHFRCLKSKLTVLRLRRYLDLRFMRTSRFAVVEQGTWYQKNERALSLTLSLNLSPPLPLMRWNYMTVVMFTVPLTLIFQNGKRYHLINVIIRKDTRQICSDCDWKSQLIGKQNPSASILPNRNQNISKIYFMNK